MLLFCKALFKAQQAGCYRYADDPKDTELVITDQFPYNVDAPEKRPAIVTLRGPASWAGLGLNQQVDYNFTRDRTTKQDLISTTITLVCLSREGVEAERLGWFLFSMIPLFKGTLCRGIRGVHDLNIKRMSIGGEEAAESLAIGSSSPEWRMVRVTLPATLQHRGSIEPVVKTYLREIEMALDASLAPDLSVVVS
jgi:hypothetical protein